MVRLTDSKLKPSNLPRWHPGTPSSAAGFAACECERRKALPGSEAYVFRAFLAALFEAARPFLASWQPWFEKGDSVVI